MFAPTPSSISSRWTTLAAVLATVTFAACSSNGNNAAPDAAAGPDAAVADSGLPPTPDAATPDAAPPAPDAAPVVCSALTFTGAPALSASGSEDLFGTGAGAWTANGAVGTPPGDLLYVEAYRDLITGGDTVTQTEFQNWVAQCSACVFLARQCTTYTIEVGANGSPVHPTCDKLFMLDKGVVNFTTFNTAPGVAGRLAGTVMPLTGETTVRLVEVNREGAPMASSGFGSMIEGGDCLELPSLAFDGSWTAPAPLPDAGVPDGGPTNPPPPTPAPDAATP